MPLKNTYGLSWPTGANDLYVEMSMILGGGEIRSGSIVYGDGLFHHYRMMQTLLWPEDDHHRWSDLILSTVLKERITVITGPRDSGKSRSVSKWVLCDYFCYPNETLHIMTSTNTRGLELRVWGDIKSLFMRARDRWPDIPGNAVDAKYGIFTDTLDDETGGVRDMRKGIIGVPCIGSSGEFLGMSLANFAGIKQKRRRLIADELQFIPVEYLKTLDAMDKGDFHGAFLGNPIAENGKALDTVSEPEAGWDSIGDLTKTTTWRNKYRGVTINLVGTDSPNFDADTKDKFPYLINKRDADTVSSRPGGKDSMEWWSLIMGVRKAGVVVNRVMTVDVVENNRGFEKVVWAAGPSIKLYAIDAGYGGDECVRTYGEIGEDVDGRTILSFGEQTVIPVLLSSRVTPEDQIAIYAKSECDRLQVPYANVFFEAGMRATLATAFSRILSPDVNAINFGGSPTSRPVSGDLYIYDDAKRERRLKRADEHYVKFVTELSFSVKELVESGQARNFPRKAAAEFAKRKWEFVYGDKYEVETKIDYKERNGGVSPNYSDSVMICVEGARRLGFEIKRQPQGGSGAGAAPDWLEREAKQYREAMKRNALKYGTP